MKEITRPAESDVPADAWDDDHLDFPLPPALVAWLPDPKGTTVSKAQVETWVRAFHDGLGTLRRLHVAFEANQGLLAHTTGTYLRELHAHKAWETLGLPDFPALCEQHLKIRVRTAYRLMFFAQIATSGTASLGIRKCIAGFALAGLLGVDGLAGLLPTDAKWKEPAAWAERLGEPVNLAGSSAARIEDLVFRLRHPVLPEPRTGKPVEIARRRRDARDKVARKHPALNALGVKSYVRDGKARVKHRTAETAEECAALAALYAAFAKID